MAWKKFSIARYRDDTLEILNQYATPLTKLILEPDRVLYDAINKGIQIATGEVIGILNADDYYTTADVLETVVQTLEQSGADSCYGDLEYVDRDHSRKVVRSWVSGPYDPSSWHKGWMIPHPTFFVRRTIFEKYGLYRLDLGASANYELMLRFCVKQGISTAYIPRVLVRIRTLGLGTASLTNRIKTNLMDRKAWKVNGLKPKPWTITLKPIRKIPQWF